MGELQFIALFWDLQLITHSSNLIVYFYIHSFIHYPINVSFTECGSYQRSCFSCKLGDLKLHSHLIFFVGGLHVTHIRFFSAQCEQTKCDCVTCFCWVLGAALKPKRNENITKQQPKSTAGEKKRAFEPLHVVSSVRTAGGPHAEEHRRTSYRPERSLWRQIASGSRLASDTRTSLTVMRAFSFLHRVRSSPFPIFYALSCFLRAWFGFVVTRRARTSIWV